MMEVTEIAGAARFFIQIAESDVEAHGAIAHGGGVEFPRRHFEAGIEIYGPFDDVSFAARFDLDHRFLHAAENPFLVSVPGRLAAARLAFEQSAYAHAAFAGLGEIADHLPGEPVAGRLFLAGPTIGGVDE